MKRLLAAVALLALGCNTLPIGEDGLGRLPAADSLIVLPDSSASYGKYVPLGAADTMYLGRDDQYESRVLIKFALPDSALDSISSVQLILHPADSTPMSFVCHPCSVDWHADAATWRLADSGTHWISKGGDYRSTELCRGTFEGESLVIDIDVDDLEELVHESYGIFLLPEDTGFVALHSGLSAATAPRIRMVYGAEEEELLFNATEDAHLVDTVNVNMGYEYRAIGSGFAFRTYLYFNLDSIPVEATVARAELTFLPSVEYRRRDTLRLGIHRLVESFARKGRNTDFKTATSGYLNYVVSPDTDSVAVFDIAPLVQYWTTHPDSNFGLYIMARPEWSRMFRVRLPVSGPNSARLDVFYAMPPVDRFW